MTLKLTKLIHHHYLHQQTRVHISVKIFVRIMALFDLEFWLSFLNNLLIFKTITDMTLKLTKLIRNHYLHQQTRVHISVKIFVRIMALFDLEFWLKFFLYQFTYFQNNYRYDFETYKTYSPSLPPSTDKSTYLCQDFCKNYGHFLP